jgi:hypothetical protein
MAALTSTQSGNFSSASTWGGTSPADGDTFTIAAGHKVTINSDLRPTNGYGDIAIYGNLHFATNGKFRLNGRITSLGRNTGTNYTTPAQFAEGNASTGSLLSSSGNNMLLEVRGSNADQHGIWVETVRYASMKLEADEYLTTTTLSSAVAVGDDYITVSQSAGFAEGDWISVFKENEDNRVLGDEGLWVHDVDSANNRIYVRQFVHPTAIIQSVNGAKIVVDDASVFRKGYKLICGTQSVRKVAEVSSINYASNELTMTSSYSSSQVGKTLHQTGLEKIHASGKKVQKLSTTIRTEIATADSTNQIVVGSSNDISVGDEIVIDVNNDVDRGWDYESKYTVTAKSGNTLTLNDDVRQLHKVGSLVNVLNRHFTIKGVDTSADTRPFLYVEYWTDFNNGHTRHIGLKNIRFTQWGNNTNSSYYRGVMIAGYNSEYRENENTNGRYQYQSNIQGCVVDTPNTANQSYTGIGIRHPHGFTCRNNTLYYAGNHPIWSWSSQHNIKIYNNYITRSADRGYDNGALYEPYCEISYNYITRIDDYGMLIHHNRGDNTPIRHNYMLHMDSRPFYCYYWTGDTVMERMYFDGFKNQPYIGEGNGTIQFLDSYMDNKYYKSIDTEKQGLHDSNRYFAYGSASGKTQFNRTSGKLQHFISYEHNFKYDAKMESFGGAFNYHKSKMGSYREAYTVQGNTYTPYIQQVYVPAAATVRISMEMNLSTNSHTRPHLFAMKANGYRYAGGRYSGSYTGNTDYVSSSANESLFSGFLEQIQYTSAADGNWEKKQLTVSPQAKGYFLLVGNRTDDNSRDEKHLFELPDIMIDTATSIKKSDSVGKSVSNRASFTSAKKRIGGTRL